MFVHATDNLELLGLGIQDYVKTIVKYKLIAYSIEFINIIQVNVNYGWLIRLWNCVTFLISIGLYGRIFNRIVGI